MRLRCRRSAALACALALALWGGCATLELSDAAGRGDLATVQRLLDAGVDVNQTDAEGVSALHVAAAAGQVDVVRELLAAGAPVDLAEFDGDTALVNASYYGHTDVVALLLESGADPDVESSQGYTPVQHARREGHAEVVALLREAAERPRANLPSSSGIVPSRRAERPAQYEPGYRRRLGAVVGINAYRHWPRLSGARADAEKVAARLRALGFDEVLELYDRDATREAILDLLGRRLTEAAGENDLVVIFFAGHGETETLEAGGERKRGYIIPVDAGVENVFSTAISMRQLRELTNRLAAKHVYYAMDSCYSRLGFTRGLGRVKAGAVDYFGKVTSLRSVQMVTAGGEGEQAIERAGEGIFTRSFLDALGGAADANGDGVVTATEIGAFIAPRVTNQTGARQSPQAGRLEGEGEIAFELGARD